MGRRHPRYLFSLSLLLLSAVLLGCGGGNPQQSETKKTKFTLGCMPLNIPTIELLKEYLEAPYEMEISVFDANNLPAIALKDGNIDSLILNHKPWIDTFNKEQNANLIMLKPYFYYSVFGIYSIAYNKMENIPNDSVIAMPGDATNMDRSLRLLQKAGLVVLGEKSGNFYSLLDVQANPRKLRFLETETASTTRVIKDCAAIVSFSSIMRQAGFVPWDHLLYEDPDIYGTGLVVMPENADAPWAKAVIKVFQLPEFRKRFDEYWKGAYALMNE